MTVTAKLQYLRISPRKVRLIADLIRGKGTQKAQTILSFTSNKSAGILLKLLNQAVANAKNNFHLDETNLYVSKIIIDGGPILKRSRPRARGSAFEILKRTSHVTITLDEVKKTDGQAAKAQFSEKVSEENKEIKTEEKKQKPEKTKIKTEKENFSPKTGGVKNRIFRRQTF